MPSGTIDTAQLVFVVNHQSSLVWRCRDLRTDFVFMLIVFHIFLAWKGEQQENCSSMSSVNY